MSIKKITPILIVDDIEAVLPLWDALGFKRTTEVPHGDRLGFVILAADGLEVMYETFATIRDDDPAALETAPRAFGAAGLFLEVADLEAYESKLPPQTDVFARRRKTFYGSTETIVRDAAGNVITFAQF